MEFIRQNNFQDFMHFIAFPNKFQCLLLSRLKGDDDVDMVHDMIRIDLSHEGKTQIPVQQICGV